MRRIQNNMSLNLIVVVFISVLHIPVNDATGMYLVQEPITMAFQANGSYVLTIQHETAVPVECYLQNDTQKYSIELFHPGISPLPIPNDTYMRIQPKSDDSDIITSLGNGICGFKVDSALKHTKWNLSFVDQARNIYYTEYSVVIKTIIPRHIVKYEKVGDQFSIGCINESPDQLTLIHCKLYDPQNRLILFNNRECSHNVVNTTVSDFGVYRCLLFFKYSMTPTEHKFELIPKETNIIRTWTNETDNHVNVGCSITNASFTNQDYCTMIRPDGAPFLLKPGLATKRYTTLGTDLKQNFCVLQITLPLEASEKGLWRCEQHGIELMEFGRVLSMGGFINVSAEDSLYKPEVKLPVKAFAHINSSLTLKCEVPFSSPYCYMRGPDGFMYPNIRVGTTLGQCEFVKESAQISDNGTWMCAFGRQTGEPDAVYTFEVIIPDPILIKPEEQEIEAKTAGTVRLGCTTKGLGGYPLKYCRFLSPDGTMYQIENRQTSDRISYDGRGLEYGDCGIVLRGVIDSDKGTWSCITRLETGLNEKYNQEVYTNVHLSINDNLSLASTLGISFGVIGVGIVGAVFFIHRYQKRRTYQTDLNANNSSGEGRASQDSTASNQNQEVVLNVGNRSYNSTDVVARYVPESGNNPFVRNGGDSDNDSNSVFDVLEMDNTVRQRL